jgi:hypothetical protein
MGMFDYITYEGHKYQTKDTNQQALDDYEIREDGTLWRECYTMELHDDPDGWLKIRIERKNHYWKFEEEFDGLIRFYREDKENGGWKADNWIEYKALFMDGKMIKIEKIDSGD